MLIYLVNDAATAAALTTTHALFGAEVECNERSLAGISGALATLAELDAKSAPSPEFPAIQPLITCSCYGFTFQGSLA